MLHRILLLILFSIFYLTVFTDCSYGQEKRNNALIMKDSLQQPEQHLFYQSKSISIYVDKVLPNSPNFWLRFVIQNHEGSRPTAYFEIKNPHKHIYPNQWGIYTTNKRVDINEMRITPLPLDSFTTPDRKADWFSHGTDKTHRFKDILPNGALEYYVEFNGSEEGTKKHIQVKKGEYFIVSLDGQLFIDFLNHQENITCNDKLPVNRKLVLPYPVKYKTIPAVSQTLDLSKPVVEKAGNMSTYQSGIGLFYRPAGNKKPIAEMINGNHHITDIGLSHKTLDVLVESDYPKNNYYLAQIPWSALNSNTVKNISDYYVQFPGLPTSKSPLSQNPLEEKILKKFLSSKSYEYIKTQYLTKAHWTLAKVVELSDGFYLAGLSRDTSNKNIDNELFRGNSCIILLSDFEKGSPLKYEIPFSNQELVSFDVKGDYLALALNSDQGFRDGELLFPFLTTQVFLIDISLISGNVIQQN